MKCRAPDEQGPVLPRSRRLQPNTLTPPFCAKRQQVRVRRQRLAIGIEDWRARPGMIPQMAKIEMKVQRFRMCFGACDEPCPWASACCEMRDGILASMGFDLKSPKSQTCLCGSSSSCRNAGKQGNQNIPSWPLSSCP